MDSRIMHFLWNRAVASAASLEYHLQRSILQKARKCLLIRNLEPIYNNQLQVPEENKTSFMCTCSSLAVQLNMKKRRNSPTNQRADNSIAPPDMHRPYAKLAT